MNAKLWTGRILTTLGVLFMAFDVAIKFTHMAVVADSMKQLGYSPDLAPTIGTIGLVCLVLYLVPRTSILGAILLTGYFGGAIASQLRVGNPLFSNVLFPIYIALLFWGGLYLRDSRVRALIPVRVD